jgi:hypothetical protein
MLYYRLLSKKKNYSIKFVFLLSIILIIFIAFKNIEKIENLKVCLCTVGKEENLYVREYVTHYKNYNLDKIFIYDNNEINGEKFDEVIGDYISSGFVEIVDVRGKIAYQIKAFQECMKKNINKFDWILFYDMDEYIYLKRPKNIKYYLGRDVFHNCEAIQLNLFFHTDNNKLYYENKPLAERFKERKSTNYGVLKSILKGNVETNIYCPHELNRGLRSCDGFGNFNKDYKPVLILTKKPDFKYYYIDHYSYKSVEEFAKKLLKTDGTEGLSIKRKYEKVAWYFGINKLTKEKIYLLENITKLNLSHFKVK